MTYLDQNASGIFIEVESATAGPLSVLADFSIKTTNQTLLITGGVGSGKSLLARAICGDFHDSTWIKVSGLCKLQDHSIVFGQATRTSKVRIGFLPQSSTSFFITNKVESEILVSQTCSAQSALESRANFINWLKTSPLSNKAGLDPLILSGGQQRLLMLETLLETSPNHLVIDGGMVFLDAQYRARASELIQVWLSDDPGRTFICFGTETETTWFDFGAVTSLSARNEMLDEWPIFDLKGSPSACEVVSFRDVTAGPMVEKRHLLNGINLHIPAGTYVGLRGANGVGKSTMLRMIAGLVRPISGNVYFMGEPLATVPWNGLADGVGYLPQEPDLAGPSGISDLPSGAREERQFWMEFFQLTEADSAASYWSLSAGQRSRAILMFQAVHNPRLWILDEPTYRIDRFEIARFLNALRCRRPDVSAIVVSHDKTFLQSISDKEYKLDADGIHAL